MGKYINAFDFVNSVSYNKKDMMSGTDNDELAEKEYDPFITNKALSYYPDTILYANEMNMAHFLESRLQYYYFLNSLRPKKRFAKWVKKTTSHDLDIIKQYYGYSHEKAQSALRVLTKKQLASIKEKLKQGGTEK